MLTSVIAVTSMWMIILAAAASMGLVAVAASAGLRLRDATVNKSARQQLTRLATMRTTFDRSMVEHLPDPARRYFCYVIQPGARISTVADIQMAGEIGFGNSEAPAYQPMRARQVLAAPYGFMWEMSAGLGLAGVSGSDVMVDGRSWSRFWLLGLVPIARAGHNSDHLRASFGRVIAEAAIWTPAALLPQFGVRWSAVDVNTARATVEHAGLAQTVDIHIAADGRPISVVMPRWSNANPERIWRLQPFGGTLDDFSEFDGYLLPCRLDGGNHFGTEAYFPFYRARITAIRLLTGE